MVRTRRDDAWIRRGVSLLWSTRLLTRAARAEEVLSIRELFSIADSWPTDLPSAGGNALVVSGVEGCLDVLASEDAAKWIERDLSDVVLSFQEEYEGQAALILWMPSGRSRISMVGATEEYLWKHGAQDANPLPLGRLLFSGAESEVERVLDTASADSDYDGKAWAGLHHPRIS